MWVENRSDELRVGAKDQSNSEIARTPRNSSGASLMIKYCAGRALIGLGSSQRYQTQINSEWRKYVSWESGGGG